MLSRRARGRHGARRLRLGLIIIGVQIPAVLIILLHGGPLLLALLIPPVLTGAFYAAMRRPWVIEPRSRAHLYLGLYPFFVWWVGTTAFALFAPFAWLLAPFVPHAWLAAVVIAAGCGLASIRRTPRIRRIDLHFERLPAALDGLVIVQLSDIHCGAFAPESRVADWVRRANRLGADIVAVTGDLIARGDQHLEAVARALAGLRARRGVFISLGNHDYFGPTGSGERLVRALENHNLQVLRNRATSAGDGLLIGGVDDTWSHRADLSAALAGRTSGDFTLLLAHDPDLFPRAAALGADLTLAGHTHAGQLAVPWLVQRFNLARLMTAYSYGIYRQGPAVLYVNPGLGFTGPPVRIGARAEITRITLRRG